MKVPTTWLSTKTPNCWGIAAEKADLRSLEADRICAGVEIKRLADPLP